MLKPEFEIAAPVATNSIISTFDLVAASSKEFRNLLKVVSLDLQAFLVGRAPRANEVLEFFEEFRPDVVIGNATNDRDDFAAFATFDNQFKLLFCWIDNVRRWRQWRTVAI